MKIAMLGLGTVGQGVWQILQDQPQSKIELLQVLVRHPEKYQQFANSFELTTDFSKILNNSEIDTVIEVMGGMTPAAEYIRQLLLKGKNVITANKAVMAAHFKELSDLAKQQHVALKYEASVGGGIPIIETIKHYYQFDQISEISGILNGTCNFILTQLAGGQTYQAALKLAQKQGFAEADPTDDVSGKDSANKLAILANLAWQQNFTSQDVDYQGIAGLSNSDVDYHTKLIATAVKTKQGISLRVKPQNVGSDSIWNSISSEENGILIKSKYAGTTFLRGLGAGSLPTANSICSDLLSLMK